jgi:hypothetical protein
MILISWTWDAKYKAQIYAMVKSFNLTAGQGDSWIGNQYRICLVKYPVLHRSIRSVSDGILGYQRGRGTRDMRLKSEYGAVDGLCVNFPTQLSYAN